jgi:hypothetical protein
MNVYDVDFVAAQEQQQLKSCNWKQQCKSQDTDHRMPFAERHLQPQVKPAEAEPVDSLLKAQPRARMKKEYLVAPGRQIPREISDHRRHPTDLFILWNNEQNSHTKSSPG